MSLSPYIATKTAYLLMAILFLFPVLGARAQDSSNLEKIISFPDKVFSSLDKKTASIEEKLIDRTKKYLQKLQKQETKLKKKLWTKDSALAQEVFGDVEKRYADLKNTTGIISKYFSHYSAHLDSLSTTVSFLKVYSLHKGAVSQKLLSRYTDLQSKLNASEQIRKAVLQRQQLLKQQFQKLGMVKELKKFRKQVFYYQAQVKEYKQMFEDRSKVEAKLMKVVMQLPQFKDFFARNSMLGSLFALPNSSPPPGGVWEGSLRATIISKESDITNGGSLKQKHH